MVREGGTLKEIARGKEEFENFAKATYQALLDAEPFSPSSLQHICRIDIGVMMNPSSGLLEYFINEVERGHVISLFGCMMDNSLTPHRVGDQTSEVIERFLDG